MLTIPKRLPILKAATVGTAVFVVGFVGSFSLLNYYRLGMPDDTTSTANVASTASSSETNQDRSAESGQASSEENADKRDDRQADTGGQVARWQPGQIMQSVSTLPRQSQSQPSSDSQTAPSQPASRTDPVVSGDSTSPVQVGTPSAPVQPSSPIVSPQPSQPSQPAEDESILEKATKPVTNLTDGTRDGVNSVLGG